MTCDLTVRRQVLTHLERHGRTPAITLTKLTQRSREELALVLEHLLAEGTLYVSAGGYEIARVDHLRHLVQPDFEGRVSHYLRGRKDSAVGVARANRLTVEEAKATCEVLLDRGHLRATSVGSLRLYTAILS